MGQSTRSTAVRVSPRRVSSTSTLSESRFTPPLEPVVGLLDLVVEVRLHVVVPQAGTGHRGVRLPVRAVLRARREPLAVALEQRLEQCVLGLDDIEAVGQREWQSAVDEHERRRAITQVRRRVGGDEASERPTDDDRALDCEVIEHCAHVGHVREQPVRRTDLGTARAAAVVGRYHRGRAREIAHDRGPRTV
jgi:hypothetical protein